MSEPEVLVESGTFKVDRRRALEKLMRYQLPDARMYPLSWVQAAVASGAPKIHVSTFAFGFELAFGGQHWTAEELTDPYRHIFEEDPDGSKVRLRELALGLLSAMRTAPSNITLMFGHGRTEYTLRMETLLNETLDELPKEPLSDQTLKYGDDIKMSIFVSAQQRGACKRELHYLTHRCRYSPIPIEINGKERDTERLGRKRGRHVLLREFKGQGVEGSLELTPDTINASRLDLVMRGVTVETQHPRLPGVQAGGFLRCDGFRKSLSQMGVVKDERYRAAMKLVEAASLELLQEAILQTTRLAPAIGPKLREAGFQERWMPWEDRSLGENIRYLFLGPAGAARPAPGASEASAQDPDSPRAFWLSVYVAALREACLDHRSDMLDGDPGLPETLWDAPVLLDVNASPLTLRTLQVQSRWLSYVPYLDAASSLCIPDKAVACALRDSDLRFLNGFFPGAVHRLPEKEAGERTMVAPTLEETNLLVKQSLAPAAPGEACGEIGLSLTPHTRASRIRWISERRPIGRSTWELRGMRLEAAIEHSKLSSPPSPSSSKSLSSAAAQCLSAIRSSAPGLYREIARDYRPDDRSPRQAMIREHLLGFLTSVWDPERAGCPDHPWLSELKLFLAEDGKMLSVDDLHSMAAADRKAVLHPAPHPPRLHGIMFGYPQHAKVLLGDSDLVSIIAPKRPEAAPQRRAEASAALPRDNARSPAAPKPAAGPVTSRPPQTPKTSSAAPRPLPAPKKERERPVEDLAASAAGKMRDVLRELRRRNACPLPLEAVEKCDLVTRPGGDLIARTGDSGWALNLEHPVMDAVGLTGSIHEQMPYLVSAYFTGMNRLFRDITDEQDFVFTLALAESILEERD